MLRKPLRGAAQTRHLIINERTAMTGSPRSLAVALAFLLFAAPTRGQSLAPVRPSGQTVTPVYEGWYRNSDGSYSLSFGYYNRNSRETLDIPVGDDNRIAPGGANQ